MSPNTTNLFGDPPLYVNQNYETQPARPWTDYLYTFVVPIKGFLKKGGKST